MIDNSPKNEETSEQVFEEALNYDFPKINDETLRNILPDVRNYLSRLKRARGNLPPSATELEVSLQYAWCRCKHPNYTDLSDVMNEIHQTIEDCIKMKPNEEQVERFQKLLPKGILVALEMAKPMKKKEAVDMWVLWGNFSKSLTHNPEALGQRILFSLDRITEFVPILHKDENETLDGELITKCVDASLDLCTNIKEAYEAHNKEFADLVHDYLAGMIRVVKCLLYVKRLDDAKEYLEAMVTVSKIAEMTDDARKEWTSRIEEASEERTSKTIL